MADTTQTPSSPRRFGDVSLRGTDVLLARHNRVIGTAVGHPSGTVSFRADGDVYFDTALLRDISMLLDAHVTDRATGEIQPKVSTPSSLTSDRGYFVCPITDCPGDGRYAAPGRGHLANCPYPWTTR